MHAFRTSSGRWICIVAVTLFTGAIARGDDTADVKEVTVSKKGNVDFTFGITGLPEY